MGNSLSHESQGVLEAASVGDAGRLKEQIAGEPRLLQSVTLVKRRSVLHLAAKCGHPEVISAVLEPLLAAVREEYYAAQERQRKEQQQEEQAQQAAAQSPDQQLQEQQGQDAAAAGAEPPGGQQTEQPQEQQQQPRQQQQQQQPELQLASFKRLRHTVNARDLYRRTPLIVAAKQGHLSCTQLLVDAASNLFAMDREGNTSLHYAALHGHAEVVAYLLQRASDRGLSARFANKRNLSGFTALHYGVWSCRSGVVVPLLAGGADITLMNDRVFDAWVPAPIGSTPLHLAVMRACVPVALLLLQHHMLLLTAGADAGVTAPPSAREDPRTLMNLYGVNPAQLAAHRNHRQLAQLLMPSLSLSRVLQVATPEMMGVFNPPSLKVIAAAAVQQHLNDQLTSLAAAAAAEAHEDDAEEEGADVSVQCVAGTSSSALHSKPGLSSPTLSTDTGPERDQGAVQQPGDGSSGEPPSPSDAHSPAPTAAVEGGSPQGLQQARASSSGWYDELCCVCWECEVTVAMAPCSHALCMGCARQLVGCSSTAGVTCPLCRAFIAGFEAVPPSTRGQHQHRRKGFLLAGSGI